MKDDNWIKWYCNLKGNNLLCEIDKSFISIFYNKLKMINSIYMVYLI